MKQIFTLFIAVISSFSLYAYPNSSKLTVSTVSNLKLRVMVDGSRYTIADNTVSISNLQPGYHNVKVYKPSRGNRNNGWGNGGYELLYNGNVYVKQQYHVDIIINRFGKAFIDEQPVINERRNDDDWNDDDRENDNNWNNSNRVMNAQSFTTFKQTISNESFDNTRLTIAKNVISNNYFTTAQIKEILPFFSFENNKLEIAKYAYKSTVDKNNYFSVADCFSFSNNKEELMRYIQNYR